MDFNDFSFNRNYNFNNKKRCSSCTRLQTDGDGPTSSYYAFLDCVYIICEIFKKNNVSFLTINNSNDQMEDRG